jgi:hypothetical protein
MQRSIERSVSKISLRQPAGIAVACRAAGRLRSTRVPHSKCRVSATVAIILLTRMSEDSRTMRQNRKSRSSSMRT